VIAGGGLGGLSAATFLAQRPDERAPHLLLAAEPEVFSDGLDPVFGSTSRRATFIAQLRRWESQFAALSSKPAD